MDMRCIMYNTLNAGRSCCGLTVYTPLNVHFLSLMAFCFISKQSRNGQYSSASTKKKQILQMRVRATAAAITCSNTAEVQEERDEA